MAATVSNGGMNGAERVVMEFDETVTTSTGEVQQLLFPLKLVWNDFVFFFGNNQRTIHRTAPFTRTSTSDLPRKAVQTIIRLL